MAFVDTELRPAGEVQQKVGRLKLSELIRVGSAMFPEGRYLVAGEDMENFCGTCAIGAAMIGSGYAGPAVENHEQAYKWLGPLCGISYDLLERVSCMHYTGAESRLGCADWLEAQGL